MSVKVARKRIEGLAGHMPAVDAAHLTISQRLAAVEAVLPMAALRADEDDEFVHQMRVGSRRADAALRIFEPFLKAKVYRKTRKALKRIRKAAGAARECDVQIAMLRNLIDAEPRAQTNGESMQQHRQSAIDHLIDAMKKERLRAQQGVRAAAEKYHGKKLSSLHKKLLKSIAPIDLEAVGDAEVAMTFAGLARKRLQQLGREVQERATVAQDESLSIGDLHELRIAGKQLRYAMEVFAPCFDDELKKPYKRVEAMQEVLGNINDLDDLAARLTDALDERAEGETKNDAIRFTLEEHAAVDALCQQLRHDRDQRAMQFVRELESGSWHDVVRFGAVVTEAPLTFDQHAEAEQTAEVHR